MKKIILSFLLLLTMKAGFSTIMFTTQYNSTLDVFDVYVTSTVAYANFQQGPSTVSILFEAGYDITNVTVTTSSNGGPWVAQDKGTITVAGSLNGYKFINFLSNGSAYPIVPANSPVKLFSFSFPAGTNCSGGFKQRHVVNSSDPLDPDGMGTYDITAFLFSPSTGQLNSTNSDLTFQNCAALTPLAVHFISFTVSKNGNNSLLKWDVANEDALTNHYEIERSINKIDFKTISRIEAKNNGRTNNGYQVTDNGLLSLRSSNVIYYRIKQVDLDNHFVYSEVKTLRLNGYGSIVNLYPNPAKGFSNLSIELENASKVILSISDAAGRIVQNMEFAGYKGLNQKRIDLSKLAGGSYMLKINNGTEVQTVSLIKE